jgi:hypothetical protein
MYEAVEEGYGESTEGLQTVQIHHVLLGECIWLSVNGCVKSMVQPKCQKEDWPRHKKDPCAPIEEMVENDDIWNPLGFRKGTTFAKTANDLRNGGRRQGFHIDA